MKLSDAQGKAFLDWLAEYKHEVSSRRNDLIVGIAKAFIRAIQEDTPEEFEEWRSSQELAGEITKVETLRAQLELVDLVKEQFQGFAKT